MQIDGNCHCGLITYQATIDPEKIMICHCTDCQILSGGAFRWGTLVQKNDFRLLSGQLKIYVKTAQSGNKRALAFCGECGTALYGTDAENAQGLSLRLSTARQAKQLTPKFQIWCDSAISWLPELDSMRKFDGQPQLRP